MTATAKKSRRRPRILVLEGLSGAAWAVRRAGAEAVCVSPRNIVDIESALAEGWRWDGLLLTGGGDVDPGLYGEEPGKKVYGVNETRDFTEWLALDMAAEEGIPVLGICRGAQLMAVHNGGRLKQHIPNHRSRDHLVFAEPGSHFKAITGNAMMCVSLHHQVVLRHGDGFRVGARSKEGYIEAIESRDGRCLGVQFHPEINHSYNDGSARIFRWLACEAARRAKLNKPKVRETPRPVYAPRGRVTSPAKKNRKAGQMTLPTAPGANAPTGKRRMKGVTVSWLCPHCAMRFDKSDDREAHIYWIHGEPKITTTEPPPGHADWMPVDPIERLEDALDHDSDWLGS